MNNISWSFIWDGKKKLVKRKVLFLPKEKVCIGMINLRDFIKSKQVKSMYSIVISKAQIWNAIGKYWLKSLDEKYDTGFFLYVLVLTLEVSVKYKCLNIIKNFQFPGQTNRKRKQNLSRKKTFYKKIYSAIVN